MQIEYLIVLKRLIRTEIESSEQSVDAIIACWFNSFGVENIGQLDNDTFHCISAVEISSLAMVPSNVLANTNQVDPSEQVTGEL